jgi:2-polyprenyl-3-methyl-5-hydroxy-6-metoxy-1,4-benzoquinol methylase
LCGVTGAVSLAWPADAHTRLPSEQKLTTVPELDTVPELNAPAVASTPDETPLSTPALTKDPENAEPLALKPEAMARAPDETPTPTPVETPLGMVVPLVTTEPLDVATMPEPDPFPLPDKPKASRLVRAPQPVSKSRSDASIAARTFHIFPSLADRACHRRVPAALRTIDAGSAARCNGLSMAYETLAEIELNEPGAFDLAIARTAGRYASAGKSRGTYFYIRGKLRGDPSTRAVLDLGCGRGQLAVLLLESRAATAVRGCDWDGEKVAIANRAVEGLSGGFAKGDVRTAQAEPADTVLLIDVLHYFDRETQDALLTRAAGFVKPGGRLVLRDADIGRGWRSLMTRLEEGLFTTIKFNRGERVLFRDVARELLPLLEAQGMSCTVVPCWGRTPFSNVLLVATRR